MGVEIPLPHSNKHPYNEGFWTTLIEDLIKLKSRPTVDHLVSVILKNINRTRDKSRQVKSLRNLRRGLSEKENVYKIITFLADSALQLPALFPDQHLTCLEKNSRQKQVFTRLQISCLLSHMFLCSFLPNTHSSHSGLFSGALSSVDQSETSDDQTDVAVDAASLKQAKIYYRMAGSLEDDGKYDEAVRFYSKAELLVPNIASLDLEDEVDMSTFVIGMISFVDWFLDEESGPCLLYLSSLLLYFQHVQQMTEEELHETVTFEKLVSDSCENFVHGSKTFSCTYVNIVA